MLSVVRGHRVRNQNARFLPTLYDRISDIQFTELCRNKRAMAL